MFSVNLLASDIDSLFCFIILDLGVLHLKPVIVPAACQPVPQAFAQPWQTLC